MKLDLERIAFVSFESQSVSLQRIFALNFEVWVMLSLLSGRVSGVLHLFPLFGLVGGLLGGLCFKLFVDPNSHVVEGRVEVLSLVHGGEDSDGLGVLLVDGGGGVGAAGPKSLVQNDWVALLVWLHAIAGSPTSHGLHSFVPVLGIVELLAVSPDGGDLVRPLGGHVATRGILIAVLPAVGAGEHLEVVVADELDVVHLHLAVEGDDGLEKSADVLDLLGVRLTNLGVVLVGGSYALFGIVSHKHGLHGDLTDEEVIVEEVLHVRAVARGVLPDVADSDSDGDGGGAGNEPNLLLFHCVLIFLLKLN